MVVGVEARGGRVVNGEHATTSQHARLLVLLAEHMPVVGRHLFNDHPTIECACGNPLYTGHLVVLLAGLNADQPDQGEAAREAPAPWTTVTEYAAMDPEGQVWWCFSTTDREALERRYDGRSRWKIMQRERTVYPDVTTAWSEVRDRRAPETGVTP